MNIMKIERISGTIITVPYDHHKIDTRFYHINTSKEHLENKPVILRLHGTLGNLLDGTEHFLPSFLARHGYSSITMNTLLANLGLFYGFGIFDDVMVQIDAVYNHLRDIGFKKIVIAGHGLGGCMAVRYAALRNDPKKYSDMVGVIAIAVPYSMPDTVRRRWERFGSEPSYEEIYVKAKGLFENKRGKEPPKDEMIVVKKAHGYSSLPKDTEVFTLKTWWALAGPEAKGAKVYENIAKIKTPILLVRGSHDEHIEHREFEDLMKLAKKAGNKDVTRCILDANHMFDGKHNELSQVIVKWLNERCLSQEPTS